jgi:hypothetical protein
LVLTSCLVVCIQGSSTCWIAVYSWTDGMSTTGKSAWPITTNTYSGRRPGRIYYPLVNLH